MSKEAKLYLRTLLDYAESADGFQERLAIAFGMEEADEAKFDEFCDKLSALSSEIHTALED